MKVQFFLFCSVFMVKLVYVLLFCSLLKLDALYLARFLHPFCIYMALKGSPCLKVVAWML